MSEYVGERWGLIGSGAGGRAWGSERRIEDLCWCFKKDIFSARRHSGRGVGPCHLVTLSRAYLETLSFHVRCTRDRGRGRLEDNYGMGSFSLALEPL